MHSGSCLCGQIKFELLSDPKKVTSCHCSMCQKQHGAAFATYGSIPKNDLVYISGADKLISYNSSGSVERKFCGVCGSSLQWSGSKKFPDWVSIAISTFDTEFKPSKISDIYQESQVCWLNYS
ncbi:MULTISPECIES: GFA family protein [unclassified Colwellia]|jgi:hypothetical protein|uniref:GFA family protein n=1 Tax=unclassified Colwellia TaxID=196834 RepID=UPI0015F64663|nr:MULTISPECIES: GFA family protein [unclassified Colwellia]MBA6355130.1 GFA family protein [Colwellia sp. BRX8-3]MBA6362002.1 GFA family protein [Colwellia sp. BRX8-6]MBA6367032.1 GFA family protein [Colwellia sp. BRX8-5]MBA6376021.1 GFA family protein [Colwellia sp. BRX8-2]MBA6385235.1 GFA family protein [Colwellia sp. BRX10-9]